MTEAIGVRKGWGWPLLLVLTVSTIGDEISLLTLMFRTAGDRTPFAVPLLLVAQLLPGLLATPLIGRLVDVHDAGKVLAAVALMDAGLIMWIAWHPGLLSTVIGVGLLSVTFAIGGTATFALIPVLGASLGMTIARANAVLEFVRGAGMLVGPVAGGLLVAWGGTANALVIDAASFAVLAAVVVGSGLRRPVEVKTEARTQTLLSEYMPILRDRRTTILIGALMLGVYAGAISDIAFVFLITVSLRLGPTAFGVLTACWAGGMLAGAFISGAVTMRRTAFTAFFSSGVMGAAMLTIGVGSMLTGSPALVGVAFLIGGAANSIHNVAVRTLLQRNTPADTHGKVAALYSGATSSAGILGYVTGGLFTPFNAIGAYVLSGVLGIIVSVVGWVLYTSVKAKMLKYPASEAL